MGGHRPADWHVLDLDKDPTPGDPQRVRQLAKNLHDFADDVSSVLRDIKGMAGDDAILTWAGKTADSFTAEFEDAPGKLKKLKKSYEMAGDALADYWPKLERAQALADKALAKGREAQGDLSEAKSKLSSADSWVDRAGKEADKYKDKDGSDKGKDVPKPDEDKVKAATRNAHAAEKAQSDAKSDVSNAQGALDAAKKMAEDARKMREDAAGTAKKKIDEASDAGIHNRKWWEEVGDWVSDNWDTIVAVCKVVVAVLGIVAMIIGGPILGAIVLVAALVVLADTLNKYANGQASLWDVAFAALDCIPGMKGLTSLRGLAKGLKGLAKGGLKGMAKAAKGGMGKLRQQAQMMAERRCKSDPIDVVTGDMVASAVDVELPGVLPLTLERHHVSSVQSGRWFGAAWASTLDQRLLLDSDGVRFVTEDGMVLSYPVPEPEVSVLPVMGPRWPLQWSAADGGTLTVHRPESGLTSHFRALPGTSGAELPLAAVTDRNANTVTFAYDADGMPREVSHSGGYRVGVELDREARRIRALRLLSDPEQPPIVRYGYDGQGNLTEIYNSSGAPLRLAYDDAHRIVAWEDRNSTRYAYTYDDAGRCVRTSGSDGFHDGSFAYDEVNHRTVHTDSLGHSTTYQYNRDFRIVGETNALGQTITSEWDPLDRLVAQTDALGRTTRYVYDSEGNTAELIRPDGSRSTAAYNELRLPVLITEADGSQWRFRYDDRGNLLAITDPSGATTEHAFDPRGGLLATIDALGHARRVENDALGRPTSVGDAFGAATRFTYDGYGRIATLTEPNDAVTRFGWTPEGRMAWRTAPSGATERWTYDPEGNEAEHVDAVGGVTRYEYTHFDLLSAVIRPDGTSLRFTHDTELRLTSVTNPLEEQWRYEYDAVGSLVRETDFNGRVLTYGYDAARQLTRRTNALGHTTRYTHDVLGNIVEQRGESDETCTTFSYDLLGRTTRAQNAAAVLTFEHDRAGRVTAETCNGRTVHSTYDAVGRRTARRTASGALSSWEYDAGGRPVLLTTGGQSLRIGYDMVGRETERRVGAAVLSSHWNDDHQLTEHSVDGGSQRTRRTYGYRADGLATAIGDSVTGTRRLDLDAAGRITSVRADAWSEQYAYDATGNVTRAMWPGGREGHEVHEAVAGGRTGGDTAGERSYDASLLRRAGRTTFAHDGQGRVVRRTTKLLSGGSRTWQYHWADHDHDQLTEVITPEGNRWRYLYDPLGRRIAKQLLDEAGGVREQTDFVWDGTVLAEQTDSVGAGAGAGAGAARTLTWDWSPETDLPVAQTERRARDLDQAETDARFHAIVTDLVGAPRELVTPGGDTEWRREDTVWGLPSEPSSGPSSDAVDCPLRFPGQYEDDETGLHYNYFRYYDPTVGRFCSLDPLGLGGGPNPGWYVPNPTAWIDPFGLALCRKKPRLETGNLKEGWLHIDARHITGDHPKGPGDLMPPGTTREQVYKAASKAVRKGTRITENPNRLMQSFEKKMTVNGFTATYRVSVDSTDGNRIISFFPVGKSYK
ncbi:RHS repeat-associated core domain-containing protein [Streptomyces sp. NPDC059009]|uniref:RHS repeat-associated core domain-containing protein n=1 Tax=Streptomyces sp. NPDC059009 TaxID=3346694 RepID=UPI0036CA156C